MTTNNTRPANLEALEGHLGKDSLAAKLVRARIAAGAVDGPAALRKVLTDRLDELRGDYERGANK